jgi:hypothetical protein
LSVKICKEKYSKNILSRKLLFPGLKEEDLPVPMEYDLLMGKSLFFYMMILF